MRILLVLLLCLCLAGCATVQNRMIRLRDRDKNTLVTNVNCTIDETKQVIKEIAKEMELIEVPKVETENFMLIRGNLLTASTASALFGMVGLASSGFTRLGFFFENDKEKDITIITITEEKSGFVKPKRRVVADRIKLKCMEKQE